MPTHPSCPLWYYIGTAGWSYADWVNVFYTGEQSQDYNWLEYYSKYFNCVEINTSYYTYVSPTLIGLWVSRVEGRDDFLFTLKLHQDFTHKRDYDDEKIKKVRSQLEVLNYNGRLGGLLIQFPYSFILNKNSGIHLKKLVDTFGQFPCYVEFRHDSWFKDDIPERVAGLGVTLCSIDQPQIGSSIRFEPKVYNGRAYIRFHGRNEEAWLHSIRHFNKKQTYEQQNERYRYLYSPGELKEIQLQIEKAESRAREIYVIMNNHPGGYAPANALRLIHLLEDKETVSVPDTPIRRLNALFDIADN